MIVSVGIRVTGIGRPGAMLQRTSADGFEMLALTLTLGSRVAGKGARESSMAVDSATALNDSKASSAPLRTALVILQLMDFRAFSCKRGLASYTEQAPCHS